MVVAVVCMCSERGLVLVFMATMREDDVDVNGY
jgi:hypothetical protein